MKRPQRKDDGTYHINGKKFRELFGSRQQVMNGTSYKTAGELVKSDLMMNKWGRIVSRKKHATAKKEKRLLKSGYTAKKGKFGYVKIGTKKNRKTRKMRKGGGPAEDEGLKNAENTLVKAKEDLAKAPEEDKEALATAVTDAENAATEAKNAVTAANNAEAPANVNEVPHEVQSENLVMGGKKSKKRRGGNPIPPM